MTARLHRLLPIALGFAALLLCVLTIALTTEESHLLRWIAASGFGLGAAVFLLTALRRPAELEVTRDKIVAGPFQFELANVESANIVRLWWDNGEVRMLQIHFLGAPRLPLALRCAKWFQRPALFGFPTATPDGEPLAPEPRVLVPLQWTEQSDEELNLALRNAIAPTGDTAPLPLPR